MSDIADLIAVAGLVQLPTIGGWVTEIDGTFSAATARTYRPYWSLAVGVLGGLRWPSSPPTLPSRRLCDALLQAERSISAPVLRRRAGR